MKHRFDTRGPRFENEAQDFAFGLALKTRVKETRLQKQTFVDLAIKRG